MTVGGAAQLHLSALNVNVRIRETTWHYWRQIIKAIFRDWQELPTLDVGRVRARECQSWASKFALRRSATRYNNSVSTPCSPCPPTLSPELYGGMIHEMRETVAAKMGQYAHVNEPCHHVLYFYNCAGQPWKTQFNVRRVMDELYGPDGMVGDEDTGQMSAWYVFNAAGFYPFCPGHAVYLLGRPLFVRVTLHLANGKTFTVQVNHNSLGNRYTQSPS